MTDFIPPRRVEGALLESLGAEIEYREALVGDLAQEFASRAERDGAAKARLWYYREAVRVTPHLLRNASRGFSRVDFRYAANVIGLAYVCTVTLCMLVTLTVYSLARAVGVSSFAIGRFWAQPLPTIAVVGFLVLVVGEAMAAGFFAAWLDRRAPVVSACMLGVLWSCAMSVTPSIRRSGSRGAVSHLVLLHRAGHRRVRHDRLRCASRLVEARTTSRNDSGIVRDCE